jgi:hypothetical protein
MCNSRVPRKRETARLVGLLISILSVLISGSRLQAQSVAGEISGTITDSSGDVISGARITVKNLGTDSIRQAATEAHGGYRIPSLPAGEYQVEVEATGFGKSVKTLSLTVGQSAVVNHALIVGQVTEAVTVDGTAGVATQQESSELGGVIERKQVLELPLNGRNYDQLTLLEPGVVATTNRDSSITRNHGTQINISGASGRSNSFLLDGASVRDSFNNGPGSVTGNFLGVDAVREFRVLTNAYSAEYGGVAGGVITIVTKSGTNDFQGTAFEFLRNDNLDARNFFDPAKKPEFKRNQWGFAAGGPMIKNRTFFFGATEWLREQLGRTIVTTVPSNDARQGRLVPINPTVTPFLALFPVSNGRDFGNGLAEFSFPFTQTTSDSLYQGRIDHQLNTNNNFFGRYTIDTAGRRQPLNYPIVALAANSRSQFLTLEDTHLLSSRWVNTTRFSYGRTNLASSIVPQSPLSSDTRFIPQREGLGELSIGGMPTILGTAYPLALVQNLFTLSDDMTFVSGRHSFKWGGLVERQQNKNFAERLFTGQFDFPGIQQFLQGRPSRFSGVALGADSVRYYATHFLNFYLQDDLKVSRNLTLNLGLRLEFSTVPKEKFGKEVRLSDPVRDARVVITRPYDNDKQNWAPRIGMAWDPRADGRTIVRGAFGIFYDINATPFFVETSAANPPFYRILGITGNPPFPRPDMGITTTALDTLNLSAAEWKTPRLLQFNLTLERELLFHTVVTVSYAGSRGTNIAQSGDVNTAIPQIQANGQPFFAAGLRRRNPNFDSIDLKRTTGRSWYNALQFRTRTRLRSDLLLQGSYTFSRTMDQTQGMAPQDSLGGLPQTLDPDYPSLDRALADFHRKHNLIINGIWNLPFFRRSSRLTRTILGDWGLSGIFTAQSGNPFTVGIQGNWSRNLNRRAGIDRPSFAQGFTSSSAILGGPDRYFNPAAFILPLQGTYGDVGRNSLIGPNLITLDTSAVKSFGLGWLGSEAKLQFRFEAFNLLNRANFQLPRRIVFAGVSPTEQPLGNAGTITSTTTSSRQIQLGVRLSW